jgi:CO dehydrogenase/acetyl-CoA synthase beta subunit
VSSKKLQLDAQALNRIREFGLNYFHSEKFLPEDTGSLQVFLILKGLEDFLMSKGIEPNFKVKPAKEEPGDTTPLDDL